MPNSELFEDTTGVSLPRSKFSLSYSKKFTCDMGQVIPIACDEVFPGDRWQIGNEVVARLQPMLAPIMHKVRVNLRWFFVPNRIVWNNSKLDCWNTFITRGADGLQTPAIPLWTPSDIKKTAVGSLWDFMGFQTDVIPSTNALPIDFPRRGYNLIWNEYFRDENFMPEVPLDNEDILYASWRKDYFTSALPWQQKGTSPSIPLTGTLSAEFAGTKPLGLSVGTGMNTRLSSNTSDSLVKGAVMAIPSSSDIRLANGIVSASEDFKKYLNENTIDFNQLGGVLDIEQIRRMARQQQYLELNARGGSRPNEYTLAHWGVTLSDARIQRPEYIGGITTPLVVSEVLQTSSSDTSSPQANMAGHGFNMDEGYIGDYVAEEHGVVFGLMYVIPEADYMQGINRQWLRRTNWDYPEPVYEGQSEQAVKQAELLITGTAENDDKIFGYQGYADEVRTKQNMICSEMRTYFKYWHLGREFDKTAPPALNAEFLYCKPRKDIFAVKDKPCLLMHVGNLLNVVRTFSPTGTPGVEKI